MVILVVGLLFHWETLKFATNTGYIRNNEDSIVKVALSGQNNLVKSDMHSRWHVAYKQLRVIGITS